MFEAKLMVANGGVRSSSYVTARPMHLMALVWNYPPRTVLDDLKSLLGIKPGADFEAAARHEPGAWYPADLVVRNPEQVEVLRLSLCLIPTASELTFDSFVHRPALRVPDGSEVFLQFGEPIRLSVESVDVSVLMGEQ